MASALRAYLPCLQHLSMSVPDATCCRAQGQNGQQPQQQQQGGMNQMVATVLRFALMWYMMSYFKGSQNQPADTPAGAAAPLYAKGELVDMYVYLSESPIFNVADRSNAELIWTQTEISLAAGPERTGSFVYRPTEVSLVQPGSEWCRSDTLQRVCVCVRVSEGVLERVGLTFLPNLGVACGCDLPSTGVWVCEGVLEGGCGQSQVSRTLLSKKEVQEAGDQRRSPPACRVVAAVSLCSVLACPAVCPLQRVPVQPRGVCQERHRPGQPPAGGHPSRLCVHSHTQ